MIARLTLNDNKKRKKKTYRDFLASLLGKHVICTRHVVDRRANLRENDLGVTLWVCAFRRNTFE